MRSSRRLLAGLAFAAASLGCDASPGTTSTLTPPDARASLDAANDGVRVYQFRTEEDPDVTGGAAFCATAPFETNVVLNASAYSEQARSSDGGIVNKDVRRIGTALACAQITTRTFPANLQQNFYARFELPDGTYTALGVCTIVSNNVPVAGIVLAGCSLKLVESPAGVAGGAATSLSVLNVGRVAGFATGSQWTIQAYESP